jgi:transcriptional regulator with XRE-family HTH domain
MAETAPRYPATDGAPSRRRDTEPLWRHVLGKQLRNRRLARGETLFETAERAGVSPQYLSEMERGIKEPSSEMIAAVAGALDTSLVDLTTGIAEALRTPQAQVLVGPYSRAAFALAA